MSTYTGLPLDTYVTTQAEADIVCVQYVRVDDSDILVYVTREGRLRAKEALSSLTHTIEEDVLWVSVVNPPLDTKGVRIFYVKKDHSVWLTHLPRIREWDQPKVPLTSLLIFPHTISVSYRTPRWIFLADDGTQHWVATALDDRFTDSLMSKKVYDNLLDPNFTVTKPTMAIHRDNTNLASVAVEYTDRYTSSNGVGTYVFEIPGLTP